MQTTVKRAMHFLFSVVAGCGIYAVMPEAASQEAGWITLFDGKDSTAGIRSVDLIGM